MNTFATRKKIELLLLVVIILPLSWFVVRGASIAKLFEANQAAVISSADNTPPQNFYFKKDGDKKPAVSASSYVVGDLDTGEIILAQNDEKKFPIASISKLMTAVVSEEAQNPEDIITISNTAIATEGENGNFRAGEKISEKEILYPLLLESSNDAAVAIAEHSGFDTFMALMNEKAKELGLLSTHFEEPSGLSANNQSTALDLFRLSKYLKYAHPDILEITQNKSYKDGSRVWFSNSQFLYDTGYLGGKSGYTYEAKQTVVSLFSLPLGSGENRNIAITLLHSSDRAKDVETILKYLNKNIYYGTEAEADASWAKDLGGVAEIKDPDFVTLAFAGDIMLDRGVKSSVNKNFSGDYSKLFDKLGILKAYDVVFANLEGPASDRGKDLHNLYSFRMDPSVIPVLKGASIDVLSVANNHVGDWGPLAFIDTLYRLKENEILYTGGGSGKAEAETPAIVDKYGIKIGFLAFSDKGPYNLVATANSAGVLLASDPAFDEIVKDASKQVDFLVVSFHFGEEYQKAHDLRQEELAYRAIDDGAKIVVGSHPHVVEDTEVYKNGYIAYSLGNFIFDQSFSEDTMQGLILGIKLNKDGSMSVSKNIVKLNKFFQPAIATLGKEIPVKFSTSQ